MTDQDTETVDADAVPPRDLTPDETITPDLTELDVVHLAAVLDNDTDRYALAGRVPIPAAVAELQVRAARLDDEGADTDELAEGAEAAQVLLARNLPAPPLPVGAELEPGSITLDPDTGADPLLAAQGFGVTRERLTSAGRDIASVPVELIDSCIGYAESALTKARIAGAQDNHLDAIDSDVQVLRAIRRLRLELKTIGERQAARQRLRG